MYNIYMLYIYNIYILYIYLLDYSIWMSFRHLTFILFKNSLFSTDPQPFPYLWFSIVVNGHSANRTHGRVVFMTPSLLICPLPTSSYSFLCLSFITFQVCLLYSLHSHSHNLSSGLHAMQPPWPSSHSLSSSWSPTTASTPLSECCFLKTNPFT